MVVVLAFHEASFFEGMFAVANQARSLQDVVLEAVLIQSFMDEGYRKYRESLPLRHPLSAPEPVIRARWVRENYYLLLEKFMSEQERDEYVFHPEVDPSTLSHEEWADAQYLIGRVKCVDVDMHVAVQRTLTMGIPPYSSYEHTAVLFIPVWAMPYNIFIMSFVQQSGL